MSKSSALTALLFALSVSATPIVHPAARDASARSLRKRLWTDTNCTGTTEGDTTLVPAIPTTLIDYLESDLKAAYSFDGADESGSLSHVSLCTSGNDTSVISVAGGASLDLSYVNLLKYGYSLDLNQASFFGVNAMINVANASYLTADHLNFTSHNGAAGIYSYGTGSIANVTDSTFFASGPVSHGVYAGGNGTANATNFYCMTEGYRSSCFSGDSPAGFVTVRDSEAYTYGHGSAVNYCLGVSYLYNIHGYADVSPWTYMDGTQETYVFDSDLEGGGNQAGAVLFSSQGTGRIATVNVTNSILRTHGENAAAFGVAGTVAHITLRAVKSIAESNILIAANTSTNPQSFLGWVSPEELGSAIPGANAIVRVHESLLDGDLVAINGSSIDFYLSDYSVWTGKVTLDNIVDDASAAVYLDETSGWSLTGDSRLQNFTITGNSLANIESNGFTIYYNKSQSCNSWIGNTTSLSGGGSLVSY